MVEVGEKSDHTIKRTIKTVEVVIAEEGMKLCHEHLHELLFLYLWSDGYSLHGITFAPSGLLVTTFKFLMLFF